MRCIFHPDERLHHSHRYLSFGNLVEYPEQPVRIDRLMEGVRRAGLSVVSPTLCTMDPLAAVHTGRYLRFLEKGFDRWRAVPGSNAEMMPSIRPVERPRAYPESILGRAGWHLMDFSCPVTETTWRSVHASASSAVGAADLVLGGERAAYALCRPPGHHAYTDRAGGFCYLNNCAIAAQHLTGTHPRVAILDIDVHHGNGTQGIFFRRNDVLTVSIHADPATYYPFYYGYADQRGAGEGEGFNHNLPLPVGSGDGVWMAALSKACNSIAAFSPGALVLALGLDAHEADPLKGGAVTTAGFGQMAGLIAGLGLPTVIVQEGGYLTDQLGGNLASFLTGFEKMV